MVTGGVRRGGRRGPVRSPRRVRRRPLSTADGFILWTQSPHGGEDERGSVVGRAELDGSGADGSFVAAGKAPAGVAVDGRYVYWANYGSGTIGRARIDGSDVNKRFIDAAEYSIVGIAVDGRHVYWTYSGLDPNSGT